MSKRNTKDHPLTKGGALIQAREILGPAGTVRYAYNVCVVGRALPNLGMTTDATGSTWEEALEKAKETEAAAMWKNQQMGRDNAHAEAVNSLRAKTKEFLKDSKFMKLLNRSEIKFVTGGLRIK